MLNNDQIEALDRLLFGVIGALHRLFGFTYDKNTESYTYIETFDTIANFVRLDQIPGSIEITQEADFVCTRIQMNARLIASSTAAQIGSLIGTSAQVPVAGDMPDAPFLVTIKDGGTDRQIENEPVDAHLVYGSIGGLPGILSKPRMFGRNSNTSFQVTLLKAAAEVGDQMRITIALLGWKIFDADALDLTSRRS